MWPESLPLWGAVGAGPDNESGDEARNIVERAASFVSRPRLIGGAGLFWLAFVVSKAVV